MQDLNRTWLDRDYATNVLAFPMQEGEGAGISPLLGDVVLCADTAQKEAAEAKTSLARRLEELLVHGILHLYGYDHATQEETEEMEAQAERLLGMIREKQIREK